MNKKICEYCGGKIILQDGHHICEKCGALASNENKKEDNSSLSASTNENDELNNKKIEDSPDISVNEEIDSELKDNQESISGEEEKLSDSLFKNKKEESFNTQSNEIKVNDKKTELGVIYLKNYDSNFEQKLKIGYSLLANQLYTDASNGFKALGNGNINPRVKIAQFLADNKIPSIDALIETDDYLFNNLDLICQVIDWSKKEEAESYLQCLLDRIFNFFNNLEFDKAYLVYSKICNYDTEIIQNKHSEIVENAVSFFDYSGDFYKVIDLALKYIIQDKEEYSNTIFNLIISLVNYEACASGSDGDDIPEINKYYHDALQVLPDDLDLILCEYNIEAKDTNVNDAFAKCISTKDIDIKSKIESLNEENQDKFLGFIGGVIPNYILNEEFTNNFGRIEKIIKVVLSYDYTDKDKFVDELYDCISINQWNIFNDTFDLITSIKFKNDNESLVQAYIVYAKDALDGDSESASKYAYRVLDIEPDNSDALIILFLASLGVSSIDNISKKIVNLTDFGTFERIIATFESDEQKTGFISNMCHACIEYLYDPDSFSPELNKKIFDVFDEFIKYYPSNTNVEQSESIESMGDACLINALFEEAKKYYEKAIELDQNNCDANWGLLKAKLNCRDDEELIKQPVPIGDFPEFTNAIFSTTDNYRFTNCKSLQEEYLENKAIEEKNKEEEEIRKKKKKKIILISSIVAAVVVLVTSITSVLTVNVFVPTGIYNDSIALINDGKYREAYEKLDTINKEEFKDKDKQKTICLAAFAFNDGDFEKGIQYFTSVGGEVDVNYDPNGGEVDKNNQTIINSAKNYYYSDINTTSHTDINLDSNVDAYNFIDNDPSRDGYTFIKWKITDFKITTAYEDYKCELNLIATYKTITYTITYDLDGGVCNALPSSYNVESETFTLNKPSKTGYTFIGWTGTGLSGTQKEVTVPTGSIGDRTYKANYQANKYKVTLKYNNGDSDVVKEVTYDSKYEFDVPTKAGYTFDYWNYNGTAISTSGIWKIADNVTLEAIYKTISYKITYDLNGGSGGYNPTSYTIETPTFTLNEPTRTGYTFTGWTGTGLNGTQKKVTINKGESGDKSFTANWEANKYKITLNYNYGEKAYDIVDVKYDHSYDLSKFQGYRDGYRIKKWTYNGSDFASDGTWKIAQDITLNAVYEAIEYSISYDLNYGSLSSGKTNPSKYTIETATFTLNNPYKNGYDFAGWTGTDVTELTTNLKIQKGSFGNKEFKAHYKTTVYFYINESSTSYSAYTNVYYNEKYDFTNYTPTNEGYVFKGWYYKNGSIKMNVSTSGFWTYDGKLKLYAEWEAKQS